MSTRRLFERFVLGKGVHVHHCERLFWPAAMATGYGYINFVGLLKWGVVKRRPDRARKARRLIRLNHSTGNE